MTNHYTKSFLLRFIKRLLLPHIPPIAYVRVRELSITNRNGLTIDIFNRFSKSVLFLFVPDHKTILSLVLNSMIIYYYMRFHIHFQVQKVQVYV